MTEEEKNEAGTDGDSGDTDLLKDDGKDIQRLKSWVGRLEAGSKKQQETLDAIASKLDTFSEQGKPSFGDDDQAKFNEKLHEMILDGNVMEALTLVNNVHREAETRMKAADQKKFDTAIGSLSDDPVMKNEDIAERVKKQARDLMSNGLDAKTAVSYAKTAVENEALRTMIQSGSNVSLDMLGGGGGSPVATKEGKLPPAAEAQYLKGKEKGLFDNRQEYIDNLDPRVRADWGLDA